jgi:hypothetical protein
MIGVVNICSTHPFMNLFYAPVHAAEEWFRVLAVARVGMRVEMGKRVDSAVGNGKDRGV